MRPRMRSGRAAAYFLVGLLGGVLGGLLVMWWGGSPAGGLFTRPVLPYRENLSSGGTAPAAPDGTVVRAVQVAGPMVVNIDTLSAPPPSETSGLPDVLRRL